MKRILAVIMVLTTVLSLAACGSATGDTGETKTYSSSTTERTDAPSTSAVPNGTTNSDTQPVEIEKKVLVAYFSATGTTKKIAEYAASAASADIYEILPAEPYTSDDLNYGNSSSRTSKEQNDSASRPAISGSVTDMNDYDVIFIGYPIWWGAAPKIISAFLESYDLSGKTIIPFCTSHSSGIGSSDSNLHALAPNSEWESGRRFSGETAEAEVSEWVKSFDTVD